jgi:hypothetical protein
LGGDRKCDWDFLEETVMPIMALRKMALRSYLISGIVFGLKNNQKTSCRSEIPC